MQTYKIIYPNKNIQPLILTKQQIKERKKKLKLKLRDFKMLGYEVERCEQ